jgi:hypothetical protein
MLVSMFYYSMVAALLDCLQDLDKFGLVLLKNGPLHTGPVADLQVTVCLNSQDLKLCIWFGLVNLFWLGLVWLFGLVDWFVGLVWFGLVWLVWLVWFGLVWLVGLVGLFCFV